MALRAARTLAPRAAQATARRSMATEKEIAMRARRATKNIRKITSSMKMVSAAKLKGDQNRLAAAKQFAAWTAVLDEPATPLEELEGTAGLADHSVVVRHRRRTRVFVEASTPPSRAACGPSTRGSRRRTRR